MLIKLARAIWADYAPKINDIGLKLAEHDKQLHALGTQSGEAFNNLFLAIGVFKEEQFQVINEILAIYEDVVSCLGDVDKGAEIHEDTGLTRSIGNPEHREQVRKYFDLMQQ